MKTEDVALNRFVKSTLELGEPFALRRPRRLGFWRWATPTLLAASLAGALILHTTTDGISSARTEPSATPEVTDESADLVVDLISILASTETHEQILSSADTPAEALLAWQDAPCAELLDDSSAEPL